jgi:hypothetical protein
MSRLWNDAFGALSLHGDFQHALQYHLFGVAVLPVILLSTATIFSKQQQGYTKGWSVWRSVLHGPRFWRCSFTD